MYVVALGLQLIMFSFEVTYLKLELMDGLLSKVYTLTWKFKIVLKFEIVLKSYSFSEIVLILAFVTLLVGCGIALSVLGYF